MADISFHYKFEAIGTQWSIDVFQATQAIDAAEIEQFIRERIDQFDHNYSRFRDDSLVSRIANSCGEYQLPDDAQPLMNMYRELYELTDGAVTPLIGQTLSAAGYDAAYSLRPGTLTQPPAWHEAVSYDWPTLTIKQPALLDFGAAGKGYLVDIISELLQARGATTFCVDAGGDMFYRTADNHPIDVALEDPTDDTQAIGIATLTNQAICGSSGNRRSWGTGDQQYHHIMDPHLLRSPRHIAAVWVVADNALTADALTTALFLVEPKVLFVKFRFAYAIVYADNRLQHSEDFPGSFYTT